ncbi:MAG TPA: cyclic nucleotide-binding domain-containing protein [Marmoricola sp.]
MRLHKDAKVGLIRSVPLFVGCTTEEVTEIAAIADEIDLRTGRELTTENAPGQEFVVLVEGTAEVRKGDELVNTLGPGDYVGEIALLTGRPRTATVVATSPVHALVVEGHAFQRLLEHAPGIRAKVEQVAAGRLERDPS